MRVASHWLPETLRLGFRLDAEDMLRGPGQGMLPIEMVTNEATFSHPDLSPEIHPDLVALLALTLTIPWAQRRLVVPEPVSPVFASTVSELFGLDVGPVDDSLQPRQSDGPIAMLLSGGTDSVAALTVLPSDTVLVHHRRVRHPRVPNRATHLSGAVSLMFTERAGAGRPLDIVDSDVEFICGPFPTFPSWPAIGHGALLLADIKGYGAVGAGTIIASRFLEGGLFSAEGDSQNRWELLFADAGLPWVRPIAGATEIVTTQMVRDAGLTAVTRSCQLGTVSSPCYACTKCLRVELIRALLEEREVEPRILARLDASSKVHAALDADPVQMEHLFAYAFARMSGLEGTLYEPLMRRIARPAAETDFFSRYYPPALELLPERWRRGVSDEIAQRVEFMTDDEQQLVRDWRKGLPDRRPWVR